VISLALAAAIAWAVLLGARGMFWLARDDDRDAPTLPEPAAWPAVAVIVPARDEAQTIAATVASLVAQDYPGPLRLVVVDDRSSDGTAELARAAAGPPGNRGCWWCRAAPGRRAGRAS
jgi:cellulose synthase/poly-beta-1,6-N-acetylglucosamine synthase-like glycosyltransferase